ncbi:hypothetical protein MTR_1g094255 [Medicago truncatula]|uniref:Transmembrane protein n=1 Tax=Medicago truncatula TaxID=3880 RepID=A0A072VNX5_MEDTR|nr:hypothetical protein MTR_1g094255 [Medicago truncatula]
MVYMLLLLILEIEYLNGNTDTVGDVTSGSEKLKNTTVVGYGGEDNGGKNTGDEDAQVRSRCTTFAEEDGVDDRGAKEESLSYDATFEPGDSTKSDNKQKESDKTPCSTVPAKRSAENVGGDDFENVYGDLPSSITRPKAEKMDEVDY